MNPAQTQPQTRADLESLEPHRVAALGELAPDTVRAWACAAGQRYVEIDLTNVRTRKAALQIIGAALAFPRWYGANLDALYDCLTDLAQTTDAAGHVLLLRGFSQTAPREGLSTEDRAELLDVFRDAVTQCAPQHAPLRVFYV